MKTSILIALAAFALHGAAFAQAKKPEPAGAAPAATTKPVKADAPAKKEEAKEAKPLPMNSRVDEIDAAGKTFTQVTRDGKRVKHVVTEKTEIKQGTAAAKFEDIKVGDMVAGSRVKKNPEGTEYEVIKVTKFGPKPKADEKPKTDSKPK